MLKIIRNKKLIMWKRKKRKKLRKSTSSQDQKLIMRYKGKSENWNYQRKLFQIFSLQMLQLIKNKQI